MELTILIVVFIAVTMPSWLLLPMYIRYKRRLKEEVAKLSDYDRVRMMSFLGRVKPLLDIVVGLNKKIGVAAGWMERNRGRWDTVLAKAGSPGNIDGEEFLAFKQLIPVAVFIILFLFFQLRFPTLIVLLSIFSFFLPDVRRERSVCLTICLHLIGSLLGGTEFAIFSCQLSAWGILDNVALGQEDFSYGAGLPGRVVH